METSFKEDLRRAWQKRALASRRAGEQRRRAACQKARAAARYLKERYGIEKVYLYGSLAWGPCFGERSDIDLMAEGFPPSAGYWRMLVELEEIASPFKISVVLGEDAVPGRPFSEIVTLCINFTSKHDPTLAYYTTPVIVKANKSGYPPPYPWQNPAWALKLLSSRALSSQRVRDIYSLTNFQYGFPFTQNNLHSRRRPFRRYLIQ